MQIGTYQSGQTVRFSDLWNQGQYCTFQLDVLRPTASDPIGLRDFIIWERDQCGTSSCAPPCAQCVLQNRPDILPFYEANGWDISCSNHQAIVDNWCSIDPAGCQQVKSGACASVCTTTGRADLVVENITFSSPPQAGVQTRATARLRNAGTVSTGNFNVKWFLDGVQVGYGGHTSLAPGQVSTGNVHFFWTPTTGTHRLRFSADVDGQVLESSESNNSYEVIVNVGGSGPDLVVENISFSAPPQVGVLTTATARLRNAGSSSSGSFNVKWFLDGVQLGYGLHTSLAPGQISNGNVRFGWIPTPGTHRLRFSADVDGQVVETNESNNSYEVTVNVGGSLADLVVENITFSSPPQVGVLTTATARVRNAGSTATGNFNVKWFLDGAEVTFGGHTSLAPGQVSTGNVRFDWTPTSGGTHRLRFSADVDNHVPESNELNNSFEVAVNVGGSLADLVVENITFSSPPEVGVLTTATARVRNAGSTATGNFNVKWFLDGAQVAIGSHTSLAPGQVSTGNVRFAWTPSSGGAHRLRFTADIDNHVPESNESNNTYEVTVNVGTPLADLVVDDITFTTPPEVGVRTIATARLRNVGNASSGNFNIKWFLDGAQVAFGGHLSLAPGQTSTGNVRFDWTPTTGGTHRLRFSADVDGHVQESNESNNSFEVRLDLAQPLPDLVVESISFTSPPTVGTTTTAVARLVNLGDAPSGNFDVRWFIDGVEVGAGLHLSLNPGQLSTGNVRLNWTPTPGRHRVRFVADRDGSVAESNETNNAAEVWVDVIEPPTLLIEWSRDRLTLNADGWYNDNPVTVRATLGCPASATSGCSGSFSLEIGAFITGRFYLYGNNPGTPDVLCNGVPTQLSEFSYVGYRATCATPGGQMTLLPGTQKVMSWSLWVQPSGAGMLRAHGVWGALTDTDILDVPQARIHPVVFIHGILGSMPPQDRLLRDESSMQNVLDPFIGSYSPLVDNLQKMGYEWDVSLFALAYDWRNSNRHSGGFLGGQLQSVIIPNSLAATYALHDGKADLVVHSMGGLVSRSYIQGRAVDRATNTSVPYSGDVNKVVFIASPHRGFPADYRTREGMTWSDYLYNAPIITGGPIMTVAMDGLIWPALVEKKYQPTNAELDNSCVWAPFGTVPGLTPYYLYFPAIRNGIIGVYICGLPEITPWAKDPVRGAPSLFEMLPTDDMPVYLTNNDGNPAGRPASWPWGHEVNTFLHDLNNSANLLVTRLGNPAATDNVYVIYGEGARETDFSYEVALPGRRTGHTVRLPAPSPKRLWATTSYLR